MSIDSNTLNIEIARLRGHDIRQNEAGNWICAVPVPRYATDTAAATPAAVAAVEGDAGGEAA